MAFQVLYLHWKSIRMGMIPLILAAFALPLLSVQSFGAPAGTPSAVAALGAMSTAQVWSVWFAVLAANVGIVVALSAWTWDHQVGHVYALSLPLSRARYALLKMGAGFVLILAPTVSFLVGALAASFSVAIPPGLETYPVALTLRFLTAALLTYSMGFALAAGTTRTAVIVLTAVIGGCIGGDLLIDAVAYFQPTLAGFSLTEWVVRLALDWPGPLQVFVGNWMLIDV